MNRRGFLKALGLGTAATIGGVALLDQALWTPKRTYFLAPRTGWLQPPMRMREVQQYLINNDSLPMRYDMRWERPDGEFMEYRIDFPDIRLRQYPQMEADLLAVQRTEARAHFEKVEREHGFKRIHQIELPPPRGLPPTASWTIVL